MQKIPVLAIVGPTASGKTRIAVEVCKRIGGEVVSADSMQVYKGMNIATAKPDLEEMQGIPHHMIDIISPEESFSAAAYVEMAGKCIRDIHKRKKVPVICGGTGLYVDSLLSDNVFPDHQPEQKIRKSIMEEFSKEGGQSLYDELKRVDPESAEKIHENDINRQVRAVEYFRLTGKKISARNRNAAKKISPYNCLWIGINYRNRELLYEKINSRVDLMLEKGLIKEAEHFLSNAEKTAGQAIGYKELAPYFSGSPALDECIENLKQSTRQYAKRQLTWFRKNMDINWFYQDDYSEETEMMRDIFLLIDAEFPGGSI